MPRTVNLKDKDLPVGVEIGETEKKSVAARQGGVHVAFPVPTQNARAFTLTGSAIEPGIMASTNSEQAMVGYDGALYLEHPEPGMAVYVAGVCRAEPCCPRPCRVWTKLAAFNAESYGLKLGDRRPLPSTGAAMVRTRFYCWQGPWPTTKLRPRWS